jgi:V-type H+-transporting ATPase subunit F
MEHDGFCNFFVIRPTTTVEDVERAFNHFGQQDDVTILFINQHMANEICHLIGDSNPICEVPSKDHPHRARDDMIFKRVSQI